MENTTIEWVPASADELTERRQIVRTTDLVDIGMDTLFMGDATIGVPSLILFGAPTPLAVRLPGAIGFGVVFYVGFMFSRHGLYLSRVGVTVWRTIFPRKLIPWSEVEGFRLVCKKVDLGRKEMERVAEVTTGGEVIEFWYLNRYVDFESRFPCREREGEAPHLSGTHRSAEQDRSRGTRASRLANDRVGSGPQSEKPRGSALTAPAVKSQSRILERPASTTLCHTVARRPAASALPMQRQRPPRSGSATSSMS